MNKRHLPDPCGSFVVVAWFFILAGCAPATPFVSLPEPRLTEVAIQHKRVDENGNVYLQVFIEPPPAALDIDGSRQLSKTGTYCWKDCADAFDVVTPSEALITTSPVQARLRVGYSEPDIVQLSVMRASHDDVPDSEGRDRIWWDLPLRDEQPMELLPQREQDLMLHLAPGLYVFSFWVVWDRGGGQRDVFYGFLVDVE
jgi:hypothetical protein